MKRIGILLCFLLPAGFLSAYPTNAFGMDVSQSQMMNLGLLPNYDNYVPHDNWDWKFTMQNDLSNADKEKELRKLQAHAALRRDMLEWHQLAGLATWGLWLATNLAGDQALQGLHREYKPEATFLLLENPLNLNQTQNLLTYEYLMNNSPWDASGGATHKSLAGATFAMYALTAGLAFFAPSRLVERQPGLTTIFTHRAMILIHLPAMLAMAYLGPQIPKHGMGPAQSMKNIGWLGFGALTISIATFYF